MIPGELFTEPGEHVLNPGRRNVTLVVQNSGDRPIQVGSHYHFAETNAALQLRPRRLPAACASNIASGTAVRFEPGQQRTRRARRSTPAIASCTASAAWSAARSDASRTPQHATHSANDTMATISRAAPMPRCSAPPSAIAFASPTPASSIEVEDDYTLRAGGYGEEVKFGGGKTIRDGMGQGQKRLGRTWPTRSSPTRS